ncbi:MULTISPECIES: hypothetical protein [Pseudomonas]|jgi:hypothetical protein|uniref:Uncharacterized protein n=1 Tax=Serpens gallinarum TaxID=2763075 RepID=A0ABR8TSM0_9PSED|nr:MULTISPECIES: hypothetical protein [Pseudomonas]MBD7978771.1 hypothetical protein [Serpens gallinarum]MBF0676553.1 hypothetical protein [Pseudomonas sp.]
MTAPLRVNEALLIADRAFQPFQCIAWAADYTGELSLSVIDRTNSSVVSRSKVSMKDYSDSEHLAKVLHKARQELSAEGFALNDWSMPV